MTLAFAD
jgi:hypothetical protein